MTARTPRGAANKANDFFSDTSSQQSGSVRNPQNFSDFDSEIPLSQYPSTGFDEQQPFAESEEAANAYFDPVFTSMLENFESMVYYEEIRSDEAAEDLPPENDFGNVEYKLKLCNLTMYKVKKRTT